MSIELQINATFKNILRPLDDDEAEQLQESVEKEGCREPVMTWKGQIIDGHHRYAICHKTGQSFKTLDRTEEFESEADVLEYIYENALGRRNLSFDDKRAYIGELYNLRKVKTEERFRTQMSESVDTAKTLGEKFGVSDRTVRRYGSEQERKKVLEAVANDVRKKAKSEGWDEDEDRMTEALNEVSESLKMDDDSGSLEAAPNDEFNQVERTHERPDKPEVPKTRKSHKSKSQSVLQQQKAALRAYSSLLDKTQELRLDLLFDNSLILPKFKEIYASIEVIQNGFPQPKKKFGR